MKTVLITGGDSALAKATRACFATHGYHVLYTTRRESKDRDAIILDLTDEEAVKQKLGKIGELDVLVNNAGIFTSGRQEELSTADFDKVFALNMRSLFFVTRALLPALMKTDGSIVNVSSMNAVHPGFGTAHYDASKGAVSAYTASLAAETGLRVNAIAPGLIFREELRGSDLEKEVIAHNVKKALLTTAELSKTILFLAECSGIYGQTILADNGYTLR